jgi:hypothetical protein
VECPDLTTKKPIGGEDCLDAFIEEATRTLGFLCDQHGFSAPSTEIDRRAATVTVTFTKDSVAIEAIHDFGEGDVELKIARLESGRKPEGYQVDRQGRRCRAGLAAILMKRGVRNFGLKQPEGGEVPKQRFSRLLSRYAHLLQEHAADILSGSAEALDEL